MKVTISARAVLSGISWALFGLVVCTLIAIVIYPWFVPTADGSFFGAGHDKCGVGVARTTEVILAGIVGGIALIEGVTSGVKALWRKNPTITIGGKPKLPKAKVVK